MIPTSGVSVADRLYLHYMSVRRWKRPGRWSVRYSGLAFSDDDGRSWTKSATARWSGRTRLGQVAFVPGHEFVHLFAIPAGRFGPGILGRVPPGDLLDVVRYEFWNGTRWRGSVDEAVPVVPAPVGELSVGFDDRLGGWVMLYLDVSRQAIVCRQSDELTGPWMHPVTVATAADYPQLYAPYLLPASDSDPDGLYFTLSRFGPYNVFLMRASGQ